MMAPDQLNQFYSGDSIAAWRTVLGSSKDGGMHYHHGLWEDDGNNGEDRLDDRAINAAMDRAVATLLPFITPGSRVLDVGSGWCGPLGIFADTHGCNVTGITVSTNQHGFCAEQQRRDVVLGDVEATETQQQLAARGPYDVAVLLESFTHMSNQSALLKWLRTQTNKIVLRVNTRPDDSASSSVVFGESMTLPTTGELQTILQTAGWRILHWQNERAAAKPTLDAYKRRIARLPRGAGNNSDSHLELLRSLVANDTAGDWTETHGLITVVAVGGRGTAAGAASAAPKGPGAAGTKATACQREMDEAVVDLDRLLAVSTQSDLLPGFADLFRCVVEALRPHAAEVRVPRDGVQSTDECPTADFWRTSLLRLSTKMSVDASGQAVAAINRYSVGIPETVGTTLQRDVAHHCLTTTLHAPSTVADLFSEDASAAAVAAAEHDDAIELGVKWPAAGHATTDSPMARLYVGINGSTDSIASFEWPMVPGAASTVRSYEKAKPGAPHRQCIDAALATTTIPTSGGFATQLSAAKSCWVSDRGDLGVKRDLRLQTPVPVDELLEALSFLLPVPQRQLIDEPAIVTLISVQPNAYTVYYQHTGHRASSTKTIIPMPAYPLPLGLSKMPLMSTPEQEQFFRSIIGRHSHRFSADGGTNSSVDLLSLSEQDIKAVLRAALQQPEDRISDWRANGTSLDMALRPELATDLEAVWKTLTSASGPAAEQLSVVLRGAERYADIPALTATQLALTEATGFPVGLNIYLSANRATALKPHTDRYDVFVVQIMGTKEWRVCLPTERVDLANLTESDAAEVLELQKSNPRGCTQVEDAVQDPDLECKQLVMRPNDVLYLPKGVVHTATAGDALSVHITISLKRTGLRWGDLFSAACTHHAGNSVVHLGCASLNKLATSAPAGVAWHRPFPVWLGKMAEETPEVWEHFTQLRDQLEQFAQTRGMAIDGTSQPSIGFQMLMQALEHGWDSALGKTAQDANRRGNPSPLPEFMQETSRARRQASCSATATFRCPPPGGVGTQPGGAHPLRREGPICNSACDDRVGCDCDGYYGTGCDCDQPVSCDGSCNVYQRCFVQCQLCGCSQGLFHTACSSSSSGRCQRCTECTRGTQYETRACTGTADGACATCDRINCPENEFRDGNCEGTVNAYTCRACASTVCPDVAAGPQYRTGTCGDIGNPTENGYTCNLCDNIACEGDQFRTGICSGTQNALVCEDCAPCAEGQYRSGGCLASGDWSTRTADSICSDLTSCDGVVTWQSQPPTVTTDRVCSPVTHCPAVDDGFIAVPATVTSDAECGTSRTCAVDREYELAPHTDSSARICRDLTDCVLDQWQRNPYRTISEDRDCVWCDNHVCAADGAHRAGVCSSVTGTGFTCSPCDFMTCPVDEFQSGVCGGANLTTNGFSCNPCANASCGENRFQTGQCADRFDGFMCNDCDNVDCAAGEYRVGECGDRTNEWECMLCDNPRCPENEVRSGRCEGTENGWACNPCANTTCAFGHHRIGICGSDNVTVDGFECVANTPRCGAGEYVSARATATSDLVCEDCGENEFMPLGISLARCRPGRMCEAGQYVTALLTPSTDRGCAACPDGRYQPWASQTNTECNGTHATCPAGSFVSIMPTRTSDRGCGPCQGCTGCADGAATSATPTGEPGDVAHDWDHNSSSSPDLVTPGVPCDECVATFSNSTNSETCSVPVVCSETGQLVVANATTTSDATCEPSADASSSADKEAGAWMVPVIIGIAVLFIIIVVVVGIFVRSRPSSALGSSDEHERSKGFNNPLYSLGLEAASTVKTFAEIEATSFTGYTDVPANADYGVPHDLDLMGGSALYEDATSAGYMDVAGINGDSCLGQFGGFDEDV